MCEKEGTPCEKVEGIGGVLEGACELLVAAEEAHEDVQQLAVLGTVECPDKPRIAVLPAHHHFGITAPNIAANKQATISVKNIGEADLLITKVELMPALPGHFQLVSNLGGATIAPKQERSFKIACTPVTRGHHSCKVHISSTAVNVDAPIIVSLGVTAGFPEIAVAPGTLDFGAILVGQSSSPATFVITNPGLKELTLKSATFSGPGFQISTGPLSGKIAPTDTDPQARLEFAITATPTAAKQVAVTLSIASDAHNASPVLLKLSMKGVRPEITVSHAEWDFKDSLLGGKASVQLFTLKNTGSAPLNIADIALSGDPDFSFAEQSKPADPIQPGKQWELKLACLASVAKARAATISITSDAQNKQAPVLLKLKARGVAPDIGIDLEAKDFGKLVCGNSAVQEFIIKNTGSAHLHLSSITLDDPGHFSIMDGPVMDQPIKVNGKRTFKVKSTPTLGGTLKARVTIASDALSGPVVVPLSVVAQLPTVAILPSPAAVLHHATVPNQATLTATGTPDGGQYAWTIQTPATANFVAGLAPGNVNQADIEGLVPGTTNVTVSYTVGSAPAVSATVAFHVVQVSITQGTTLAVVHPYGQPAANLTLNAVGTPLGGAPLFQALDHHGGNAALVYTSALAGLSPTLRTQARGRSSATVQYALGSVTAQASIDVDVTTLACSQVTWRPAGGGNVLTAAVRPCPHEAAFQQPTSAIAATAPATDEHHHGDECAYCAEAGRPVHHFIHSDTGTSAVTIVQELHAEIHHLRGLLPPNWSPTWDPADHINNMPQAARNYIASRPWLANVSVWLYNPLGWRPPCNHCAATGRCSNCNGTGRYGRFGTCNRCVNGVCPSCTGGFRVALLRGKMIGVLVARDAQGRVYRLRGVSGSFQGVREGAPEYGAPNRFWARQLPDRANIPSASHGSYNYDHPDLGETFGLCAATHMLAQALDQGLELMSMAEMWIGAPNGPRVDGQLQSSCPHCRQYFEHMLCDAGPQARSTPYGGTAAIQNRGQRVAIDEPPFVYASVGARRELHGLPSGAGLMQWTIQVPAVAPVVGLSNLRDLTLDPLTAGTTMVRLTYPINTTSTATITLHVLSIVEAGPVALPLAQAGGTTISVATPIPGPGTLQWQIAHPAVARFAGGVAPGNVTTVTIEPVGLGTTQLTVSVLVNGVLTGATASITINVT
ncbi:choice-of-anchor D domain-containing protein [Oxalobacteraceae bacterium]|nr:choice-of-anchor D domain-containing protein [Oxalobacteraceae bacterium]